MISVAELKIKGIKYEDSRWIWLPPGYELESSDFTDDGSFKWYTFKHFCELWAERLNEEEDTERYIVAYTSSKRTPVKRLTVVKLKEEPSEN